jgi:hypothetical protein
MHVNKNVYKTWNLFYVFQWDYISIVLDDDVGVTNHVVENDEIQSIEQRLRGKHQLGIEKKKQTRQVKHQQIVNIHWYTEY